MSTINLFIAALKGVLRELPHDATGFRVEPGASGYVMVQLIGPGGVPLVACTVAQRVAPKSDGRQLTIDAVRGGRTLTDPVAPAAPPPAPPVPAVRLWVADHEWDALGPKDQSCLQEPIGGCWVDWDYDRKTPWITATVADDEVLVALRGLCEGLAVRLHVGDEPPAADPPPPAPEAPVETAAPEAEAPPAEATPDAGLCGTCGWGTEEPARGEATQVRVYHKDWERHRPGLLDTRGDALYRMWGLLGGDRVSLLHPEELAQVQEYCTRHGIELHVGTLTTAADQPTAPSPEAPAVLYRDQPHPACDDRASGPLAAGYEVSVSVEGDKAPRMEFRGGRDEAEWLARTVFYAGTFPKEIHRLYRNGRCVWDSRDDDPPAPEQAPEPGDTAAAEGPADPAPVAEPEGDDEHPDGLPYAVLHVSAAFYARQKRALGDHEGGAHHGDWQPSARADGDRTLVATRAQTEAIQAALGGAAGPMWVELLDPSAPQSQHPLATLGPAPAENGAPANTLFRGPQVIDVAALADELEGGEPEAPKPTKKGRAKKAAKLFRDQGHELDQPWAHPNTPHLVIRIDGTTRTPLRPEGFEDSAWRAIVRGHLAAAEGYEVARLYSNRGKCLWDSRDGGAP